jgi:hypothetical protein
MTFIELIGGGILAVVLWTVISSSAQPASNIEGKVAIPYESTRFGFIKTDRDGEGTLTIKSKDGLTLGEYVLDDSGVLCESPEQAKSGNIKATFKPDLYAYRSWFDIGGFASVDTKLRLGIRFSPCRLAWDTIAPDLVATESSVGLGVSIYPPTREVGWWHHIGLGVWYLHDLANHSDGISLGLSSSIR